MEKTIDKVAIVGVGHVGEMIAFLIGQYNLANEILLIDRRISRCNAEAADMNTALTRLATTPALVRGAEIEECSNASLVIVTAAAPVRLGQTRNQMLSNNAAVFESIIPRIEDSGFTGTYLIVTNPVDLMTYMLVDRFGISSDRVVGAGTVLDTMRLLDIAQDAQVNLDGVLCVGEHGENLIVDWGSSGDAETEEELERRELLRRKTIDYAYEIVKGKGSTSFGIAQAVLTIVEAMCKGDEGDVLPLSVVSNGEYGIENMAVSLPTIIGKDGPRIIEGHLGARSIDSLHDIVKMMRETYDGAMRDESGVSAS